MSSSGSDEVSPVSTLVTVPSVLREVQEKQMPIRQPNSGVRPAASACSSRLVPLFAALTPDRAKLISPSVEPPATFGGLKNSTRSSSEPSYAFCPESIHGAGPQAQVGT